MQGDPDGTGGRRQLEKEEHVFFDLSDLHGSTGDLGHAEAVEAPRSWPSQPPTLCHREDAVVAWAEIDGVLDGPDLSDDGLVELAAVGDEIDLALLVRTDGADCLEPIREVVAGSRPDHHAVDTERPIRIRGTRQRDALGNEATCPPRNRESRERNQDGASEQMIAHVPRALDPHTAGEPRQREDCPLTKNPSPRNVGSH